MQICLSPGWETENLFGVALAMRSSQHVECMELEKQICSEINFDENTEITSGEIEGEIILKTAWCYIL